MGILRPAFPVERRLTMLLIVVHPDRDVCRHCKSNLTKAGYVVEDNQGVRQFICSAHLAKLLNACLTPLRIVTVEA
jgi:hypothetical protein